MVKSQQETSNCREIILSENTADYFVRYDGDIEAIREEFQPECIQPFSSRYAVIYNTLSGLEKRRFQQNAYMYPFFPRCYGLMDRSSMEESGITRLHRQPYLDLLGQGVLIGFVDTGIDYTNPLFRAADGTTRIAAIWDQTIQTGNVPESAQYGSEYKREDINRALLAQDPFEIVPTRDTQGHGTFLAGIAAGNNDIQNDFTGAAPLSEIIAVKLKPAKKYLRDYYLINEEATCYQENDIALGIRFLLEVARRENKPLVICFSLGTNMGGHDGSGILDQFLEAISIVKGTCVVTPTGNESGYRTHFRGERDTQVRFEDIELRIGEGDRGFCLEFWAGSLQVYNMVIISPSGEISNVLGQRLGGNEIIRFLFDRTTIYADYVNNGIFTGDQFILLRFSEPAAGIWTIRLYSQNDIMGFYDLWLPLHEFAWAETYFLEADPNITITDPGNARVPITVAAYDHVTQSIYIHSGRGNTRTGTIEPNIAAPGVDIQGPAPGGRFVRKTGTSISTAHTAGAAALLMQWGVVEGNQTNMSTIEIRVLMIQGADRGNRIYPNVEWGYGKLDIYGAFESLRRTV